MQVHHRRAYAQNCLRLAETVEVKVNIEVDMVNVKMLLLKNMSSVICYQVDSFLVIFCASTYVYAVNHHGFFQKLSFWP